MLKNILEGVYMRFHFGRNEIFSIRCLVSDQFLKIVYMYNPKWNSLRVLFYCGHFDRNENFISGDKILCKHYPKWNHMKGNICTYVNKNEWLLLNGPFISDQPRNKIRKQNFFYGELKFWVSCKHPLIKRLLHKSTIFKRHFLKR